MRCLKKVEIVDIFRIQVKRSTFVKFQLNIDENHLNVNKKQTSFWGGESKFQLNIDEHHLNVNKKLTSFWGAKVNFS